MSVLSEQQVAGYWRDGYAFVENALEPAQLDALQSDFEVWKEESCGHATPWGTTADGRARFDLEPGHCAEHPALRRVASPIEVSDAYLDVMRNGRVVDAVAQLIGPDVEFNNSKINSKQPGTATQVKYHQDFSFQPHCNGVFTGAVSTDVADRAERDAVPCVGPAGSACLMHTRVVHGSGPNHTTVPRTLFIAEYRSEDSVPLQVNHLPSRYEGELVRGTRSGRVRCTDYEMLFPEVPTSASFFYQQAAAEPPREKR